MQRWAVRAILMDRKSIPVAVLRPPCLRLARYDGCVSFYLDSLRCLYLLSPVSKVAREPGREK